MTRILFVLLLGSFLFACTKYKARKKEGTNNCRVDYHYWDMSSYIVDSIYQEDLEVKSDGRDLIVCGFEIPVISIENEQVSIKGDSHNNIQIQFVKDSIFLTHCIGGLGMNETFVYKGRKQ